ncbi:hypothetical protein [Gordoniibacillus kamchatkensis]|uniref:hypothetical protein n=1 Tax=Gordoniibacillus kamchatkensis TaxID=1590651 RepID=UPI000697DEB8|nr:hypothetical protein [Paenibacillus sp. VKM B-2647]
MLKTLSWLDQHQMNPCQIWVQSAAGKFSGFGAPANGSSGASTEQPRASGGEAAEREDWMKQVWARGYMGYALSRLSELPSVLGGGKSGG